MANYDETLSKLDKLVKSSNCPFVVYDAIDLLKEERNDLRIMFNRCRATAKLLTNGGACKDCTKREKCERLTK